MPRGDGKIKRGRKAPPQVRCLQCGEPHHNPCPSPTEISEGCESVQSVWTFSQERRAKGGRFGEGLEIEEIAFEQIHGNRVYRAAPQ